MLVIPYQINEIKKGKIDPGRLFLQAQNPLKTKQALDIILDG